MPWLNKIFFQFSVSRYNPPPILTNEPKRALHRQYIFWIALTVPLMLFLLVGSLYWKGYEFSWTKEGIDTFFEISKVPLYFLSSVIPFLILAARIHGTRQVEEQIKVTQENNIFTNYYKHRELFDKFIDDNIDDFKHIESSEALYKFLYPDNNSKNFTLNSPIIDHHNAIYHFYRQLIDEIISGELDSKNIILRLRIIRSCIGIPIHEKYLSIEKLDCVEELFGCISGLFLKLDSFVHAGIRSGSKMSLRYGISTTSARAARTKINEALKNDKSVKN
ncbi:hypothetical protein L1285_16750 [Pseudoalteromonas sp. DL2-H2.2]|uniref:hypothetical protein n=1 Tax=Pseudoalteromonas sp. DL2-H2.2 TaxID=2908889 RepID=UPI001F37838B|nr:hypothetical protein [Pseudoalteromonas sp. DL2-H2.2]MCF2909971.1 hypothetical protein [Pseudoalteromonas sp. DL2-H2.2]